MSKHLKTRNPTDADLKGNPLIGGAKGTTMARVTPDEFEAFEGATTIEGDVENDTNPEGAIDKSVAQGRINRQPSAERDEPSRHLVLQGGQTHAQQLRMLERKPDIPDARQPGAVRRVRRQTRDR